LDFIISMRRCDKIFIMLVKLKLFKDPGADPVEREVPAGATIEDLLNEYRSHLPYRIITARVDGDDLALNHVIKRDCELIFCDIRDNTANRAFQRGLALLYMKAVYDLYGPDAQVEIRNSVNRGIFTTISFGDDGGGGEAGV